MKANITPHLEKNFAFQLHRIEQEIETYQAQIKPLVTISREFGCEGYLVAYELAERWSKGNHLWRVYGRELLDESEDNQGLRTRLLQQIRTLTRDAFEQMTDQWFAGKPTNVQLWKNLIQEIELLSRRGNAIIVGAAAVKVLKHRPLALHVRIKGGQENKVKRLMNVYNLSEHDALDLLHKGREARDNFLKEFGRMSLMDDREFDLVLNNDEYNAADIADIVAKAFEAKHGMKAYEASLSYLRQAL